MNFKQIKKGLLDAGKQYSPEILTGIGVSSFFAAIIFAIKDTPTAMELIEERKLDERKDKLTTKEVIQTTWKCYVPTAVTAISGTACIACAAAKNHKKNAALAAAYGLSQETLSIYRQKVIETLGEKKESEIREKVDRERIERHPPERGFEVNPFPPDSLFEYEGDYFFSTWDRVREAVNDLGEDMLDNPLDPTVTDNDFRSYVGLPCKEVCDRRGWDLHITGRPTLYPPSCIELPNHQICFVLTFREGPIDLYAPTRKLQRT